MPEDNTQSVAINPELLRQLTRDDGGRVVLILGAGCSCEAPTSLPLSHDLSANLHRQLVRHGTLATGDCTDPEDLSELADAVVRRTGSQRELVECMPLGQFRVAAPNEGYLIAAALLREQAVACVLTLNFDLAMSSALTRVGADDVGVVNGPDEHQRLQTKNLIYLHRNVSASPEDLVLTTPSLETSWRDGWEEIVVRRLVSSPVTVFAGLGSPADVLVHCVEKIRAALSAETLVIQVDPTPHGHSPFSQALAISPERHTEMGWSEFMRSLSHVLMDQWHDQVVEACKELASENGWKEEDISSLLGEFHRIGIVECGAMRARWLLQPPLYLPWRHANTEWLADLVLVIRLVERETCSTAKLRADGIVEFHSPSGLVGEVGVAHGRGSRSWSALEPIIRKEYRSAAKPPGRVIVAGFVGAVTPSSPPLSIVNDEPEENIIDGPTPWTMVSAYELREDPSSVKGLW